MEQKYDNDENDDKYEQGYKYFIKKARKWNNINPHFIMNIIREYDKQCNIDFD